MFWIIVGVVLVAYGIIKIINNTPEVLTTIYEFIIENRVTSFLIAFGIFFIILGLIFAKQSDDKLGYIIGGMVFIVMGVVGFIKNR